MSLIYEVTRLVGELGEASGDDLLPHLDGYSREQVLQALQNARHVGRISTAVQSRARGRGMGKTLARYKLAEPGDKPVRIVVHGPIPVNSVFQLGERA